MESGGSDIRNAHRAENTGGGHQHIKHQVQMQNRDRWQTGSGSWYNLKKTRYNMA